MLPAADWLPGLKVCRPPLLSQSWVDGVVYRCHCVPVSVCQLLCNLLGKDVALFRVWVVEHGRFSCLMLLVWKGGGRSCSSSSDHSHVFVFDYLLMIEICFIGTKASVLGGGVLHRPFSSHDLPSTCLYSTHFWKRRRKKNFLDSKEEMKMFKSSLFTLCFCF